MATGLLNNAQAKAQAFTFDCKDVAFTDGTYRTDMVIRNNSIANFTFIKFFQDVSAYPAINIQIMTDSLFNSTILNVILPYTNEVNGYDRSSLRTNFVNNNNVSVFVKLIGITGSGISALSFKVMCNYTELDF